MKNEEQAGAALLPADPSASVSTEALPNILEVREVGGVKFHRIENGDVVCVEHGTAIDVHCCHCHNGFIFDADHECPEVDDDAR